jgi:outer membrane receptor protein involved in Fe transport
MIWSDKSLEIEDPSKAGQPGYSRTGERTELIGSSRHRGIEVEMAADLGKAFAESGMPAGLGVRGSFTYMNNVWSEILDEVAYDDDGEPRVFGENEETEEDLLFKDLVDTHVKSGPQTMISFGLTYEQPRFFGGVDVNWHGRYYALDGDLPIMLESAEYGDKDRWSETFDNFALVNLRAGVNLPLDQAKATLSIQVYNLFDKEHLVDADRYGVIPGGLRTIRVNLTAGI